MTAPDAAEGQRWHDALMPYYAEYGIEPPAPSTAGARRPLDAATVDLLEAFRPRIVSFHFGLPDAALMTRIRAGAPPCCRRRRPSRKDNGCNAMAWTR